MKLFHSALGSSQTTGSFQIIALNRDFPTNVTMIGNFNSVAVTMQQSPDNATFTDLYADGSLVQFTQTGEQRSFTLQPGYYRFSGASGLTSVSIYVDGKLVD